MSYQVTFTADTPEEVLRIQAAVHKIKVSLQLSSSAPQPSTIRGRILHMLLQGDVGSRAFVKALTTGPEATTRVSLRAALQNLRKLGLIDSTWQLSPNANLERVNKILARRSTRKALG